MMNKTVELSDEEARLLCCAINTVQSSVLAKTAKEDFDIFSNKLAYENKLLMKFRAEWMDETAKELDMLQSIKKKCKAED